MSEQAAQAFLDRLQRDDGLRREAAAALSAVAARHALACSPTECERLVRSPERVPDGELTDEALTAVAGGVGAAPVGMALSNSPSVIGGGVSLKTFGQ